MLYLFGSLLLLLSFSEIAYGAPAKDAKDAKLAPKLDKAKAAKLAPKLVKPSKLCGDKKSEFIYYYFNVMGGSKINFKNLSTKDIKKAKFPKNTYSSKTNRLVKGEFTITQNNVLSLQSSLWSYYVNYKFSNSTSDYYIIQPKEYLDKIKDYFEYSNGDKLTVDDLVKLNSIANPDKIYAGALLKLPKCVKPVKCFNPVNRFAKLTKC